MSYELLKTIDWSGNRVSACFHAAHNVIHDLYSDYCLTTENGGVFDWTACKAWTKIIADALMEFDYSDDIRTSVKAAGIKSAELILENPGFYEIGSNWKGLVLAEESERIDLCLQYSVKAQVGIGNAFSMWRDWSAVERQTEFRMISEPKDSNNNILRGSIGFLAPHSHSYGFTRGLMPTNPLQRELMQMNIHPDNSAIYNVLEWLSVLVHENSHGVENIERQAAFYLSDSKRAQSIDAQILLAEWEYPQSYEERFIAYEVYRARPSERLARLAEQAFLTRIKAAFIVP